MNPENGERPPRSLFGSRPQQRRLDLTDVPSVQRAVVVSLDAVRRTRCEWAWYHRNPCCAERSAGCVVLSANHPDTPELQLCGECWSWLLFAGAGQ
jgi:hypothetical protein